MPIRVYYEVLNQKGTPALYSDNYAQRPAAGYQGRIFYSPDTAQIFYDTGSTWTLLADAGVGSGSLASVCANGNTTATGISITAGGFSSNSITNTSLTTGSIIFADGGGLESQSNATFFWDNTNKRLGIGNNAPGAPLDIHGTNGTLIHLNGTGANNSYLLFQNAGVGKWRIGNTYGGATNSFGIYNNSLAANALTIDSTSNATFVLNVTAGSFTTANGYNFVVSGGQTTLFGSTSGINIGLPTTITQQLSFPTGVSYTYTFPSATGTLALTSNLSSYLPLSGGTLTGQLVISNGSTPQLQVTNSGSGTATIWVTGTSGYSTILWTGGSAGGYGQMSYNLGGNYMQFGTNASEYMRMYANGNLRVFTSSSVDNGSKFQVEGNIFASSFIRSGGTSSQFLKADGSVDSTSYQPLLTNPITGTGTTSYVPRFTGSTTLGNGIIRDDGTTVGINAAPNGSYRLYVSGSVFTDLNYWTSDGTRTLTIQSYGDYGAGSMPFINTSSNHGLQFLTNNTLKMFIRNDGVLFIKGSGTTSYADSLAFDSDNSASYIIAGASSTSKILSFAVNGTASGERMRIRADGNVAIGFSTTGYATARLSVKGADTGSTNLVIYLEDSNTNSLFYVRNDGFINTGTRAVSPYNNTSGAAANLVVTAAGGLERSTSSLKYKTDVLDYNKGLDIIKQMRPVYYKDKKTLIQYAGFIAEEINEIGLNEFVQYANDGSPDALNYANMTALLTKGIQQIDTRLTNVEEALLTLQQNLN